MDQTFLAFGRHGLKNNPNRVQSEYEEQIKAHREKIGELVLQIEFLKKAKDVLSEDIRKNVVRVDLPRKSVAMLFHKNFLL